MRNRARTPRRRRPLDEEHQGQEGRAQRPEDRQEVRSQKRSEAHKKAAKPAGKKAANTDAAVPREFSKKAIVLDLMQRTGGATMAEIAEATDWQIHSIRGFISGTITKKMGLKVESTNNEAGERTYRIAK